MATGDISPARPCPWHVGAAVGRSCETQQQFPVFNADHASSHSAANLPLWANVTALTTAIIGSELDSLAKGAGQTQTVVL